MKYLPVEKSSKKWLHIQVKKFGERNHKCTLSIIKMYIYIYKVLVLLE